MSTSPEAQQAADNWWMNRESPTSDPLTSYAEGYDAATAKSKTRCGELREELRAEREYTHKLRSSLAIEGEWSADDFTRVNRLRENNAQLSDALQRCKAELAIARIDGKRQGR